MRSNTYIISLLILLFTSCAGENPNEAVIEEFSDIYASTLTNINYPYHNSLKADDIIKKLQGIPSNMMIEQRYDAAYELLKAGRNQDCIDLILPVLEGKDVSYSNLKYYRLLANASLRLGEQENCFHKGGINACTLPFNEKTIHSATQGASQAIEILLQMLAFNPSDIESRWLLNIAARAVGRFEQVPDSLKIELPKSKTNDLKFVNVFEHSDMGHAGGSAFEDYDMDGDLDIFVTSYHLDENVTYYRNDDGKFTDKTSSMFLKGLTGGLNFVNADINNDGFVDILILRGGWLSSYGQYPLSLLINQQGKGFVDQTIAWNLDLRQPTQTAAFADLNLDGHLDLILGAESTQGMKLPVRIFENNGSSFVEQTMDSGLELSAYVKGVSVADVNNDGYPDVFISVLGGDNQLFISKGEPTINFENQSDNYEINQPWASFTSWFFDYDNDGYEDLFVSGYNIDDKKEMITATVRDIVGDSTNFSHPKLYRNINGQRFEDVTNKVGLNHEIYAMGANYGDVDNDGYLDLYLGTGEFNMWAVMPNRLFVNTEGKNFEDHSFSSGLAMIQKGHGVSFGDYDQDGDQDIFHTIGGAVEGDIFQNYLYQNNSANGNWINLNLVGHKSNKLALGARIELKLDSGKSVHRTVSTGGSFGNNSITLEIGLGSSEQIKSIIVKWPNADFTSCEFKNISINQSYEILESACKILEQ